jgi:hypothetical protein
MTARSGSRKPRSKWNVRRTLWAIWPSMPTSWGEVPKRLSPAAAQILRLTVAAVVAYVVADTLFPGILDLTAPLTALLVVQASTVGTLTDGSGPGWGGAHRCPHRHRRHSDDRASPGGAWASSSPPP